jgi:tape measure domain-containing protein
MSKDARAGGAYVEVSLRSKISENAQAVQRELNAVGRSLATVGRSTQFGNAFAQALADNASQTIQSRLSAVISATQQQLGRVGQSLQSVGSSITGMGAGIAAGFGSALAALYFPTKIAADAEMTQASFEALTGSVETARSMLAEIRQFAAATPFQFEGLTKASQTLLAYGTATKDVLPQLRLLGDVSLGNQEKLDRLAVAFGQVQAKGKLMAQEVNQMVENGFNPLQEISRTSGKDMDVLFKTMEAGGISFEMVVAAFQSATSEGGRFFEAMDKQSKTLGGRLAALKDEITQALLPIGQAIMTVLKPVVDAARIAVASLARITPALGGLAVTIGLVSVAGVAAGIAITTLGGIIVAVGALISAVGTIVGTVGAVVAAIWTPVTVVVLGVAAALAVVTAAIAYAAVASGVAGDAIAYLRSSFAGLTAIASTTFAGISDALAGGDMQLAAKILWAGLKVAFLTGLNELSKLFMNRYASFGTATARIVSEIANLWLSLPTMIAQGISSVAFNVAAVLDTEALQQAQLELDTLNKEAAKLKADRAAAAAGGGTGGGAAAFSDTAATKAAKEAYDAKIKSLREEILAAKVGADMADLLALRQQGVNDEQLAAISLLQDQRRELKLKRDAEEEADRKRKEAAKQLIDEGKQLAEAMRTPGEVFAAEVAKIQQLLDAKAIDQTTANRALAKAREEFAGGRPGSGNTLATRGSSAAMDTIRRQNSQRVSAETWVGPLLVQGMQAMDVQRQGFAELAALQQQRNEAIDLKKLEDLSEQQLTAMGLERKDLQAVKTAIEKSKVPTFKIP